MRGWGEIEHKEHPQRLAYVTCTSRHHLGERPPAAGQHVSGRFEGIAIPKALLFSILGHGHVTPSLPLVTELMRHGHHITCFVSGAHRAAVESAGAQVEEYATVQDDCFDSRGLHGGVHMRVARALLTTTEDILPEVLVAGWVLVDETISGQSAWSAWSVVDAKGDVWSGSLVIIASPLLDAKMVYVEVRRQAR